jgi:signal transduction histidine kinase
MKLVNKFAFWYLGITAPVLLLGGVIVFRSVVHENDEEEIRRLHGIIEDVVHRLEQNTSPDSLQSPLVTINALDPGQETVRFEVSDTMGWHSQFQGTERQIKAVESFRIDGHHYLIVARTFAPEPEETISGVISSLSWIFFLLLLVVALTSILVSRKILYPFNQSLRAIQAFNLKQRDGIKLPETETQEFRELNQFLEKMTTKALGEYRSLKEFTENASHELQTPLAIIRGKLELLLESNISDAQAKLIMSAYEAVEKLSRTNQSLTLLTKLENEEYKVTEAINLSLKMHQIIFSFTELMEMKKIFLETDIQENVQVILHPALADILLMNLLSNAIRHNPVSGNIRIKLNRDFLLIQNTGEPPVISTEQLFERFKKNNQSSDSIGLGLSIAKRICQVSGFDITYTYSEGWHILKVVFKGTRNSIDR